MAKLTPREIEISNKLYNQYKQNKYEFIDKYKGDAEQVMRGRAIKLAKQMNEKMNKQKVREMIKTALTKPLGEEINSAEFVQTRKPVEEKNPKDIIQMDVPLFIRMLEYAKEDAETDMDLHKVTENVIELAKEDRVLDMDDYNTIINPDESINELVKAVMTKLKSK
jgi:hypothetical protein